MISVIVKTSTFRLGTRNYQVYSQPESEVRLTTANGYLAAVTVVGLGATNVGVPHPLPELGRGEKLTII